MTRARPIVADVAGASYYYNQSGHPVVLPDGTRYAFFVSSADADLYYVKSTDGGFTWETPIVVFSGSVFQFSVWYDRWSGIDADLIHIAYVDADSDDVLYKNLNASTDTLSAQTTIFAGASATGGNNTCTSIARMRGGNLLCMYDIDGGTEQGVSKSTDAGANWSAASNVGGSEGADYFLLSPGFAADNQDGICIYWDRSADEISRKLYDDSGDSWAETSIAGSMVDTNAAFQQFSIATDLVNSKVLLIAWSALDLLNATLRFWTVDESAISAPVTIVTSTDDQGCCNLVLDTTTGDLYAFYGGKTDGSETWGTTTGIYYRTSTDDGATWGAETTLVGTLGIHLFQIACPRYTSATCDFCVTFVNDKTRDLLRTSVEIPAGGGMLRHPGMTGGLV